MNVQARGCDIFAKEQTLDKVLELEYIKNFLDLIRQANFLSCIFLGQF